MKTTISANPTRPNFFERDRPREHKDDLDVEDHEEHRNDVVPDGELQRSVGKERAAARRARVWLDRRLGLTMRPRRICTAPKANV